MWRELNPSEKFCAVCGAKIEQIEIPVEKMSKSTQGTRSRLTLKGKIILIGYVALIIWALRFIAPAIFGGTITGKQEILEAAESKANSIVVESVNEVPQLESELIERGNDWALVLVRYKTNYYDGCFVFHVSVTGYSTYVYARYKESMDYNLSLSETDIEKIKLEWELK